MLEKTYNPQEMEDKIYEKWLQKKVFQCQPESEKEPFCILMPPPNVTGNLHIGHALDCSMQDAVARFKRMKGFDVLWQPGMDHAGISTQMMVERMLAKEGKTRHDLGRQAFVEKVWEWKKEYGGKILNQQKKLGALPDWSRERFTLDEGLSAAVRKVFVQLYKEGLIYKDKRLVNWDTALQSAVSDLEVEQKDVNGSMWYIRYPVAGEEGTFLTVATTRPETMFGDTAVAVNAEDKRYKHLIGKYCVLPIADRLIPIVADEHADPEKGTGAVKITPAHDFNDFEVGRRHNLEMINILDSYGHLNENVPTEFQGLEPLQARPLVLEKLKQLGVFEKTESHPMTIPYSSKSGTIVEPWLTDQWFVDAKELAKEAIRVVENGEIKYVPDNWKNLYFEWMYNIQPWCISRQLWWGHQIPVWYGPNGEVFCEETFEQAQAMAEQQLGKGVVLTQDTDVLDTWFSSGLWAFTTLGWPQQTKELQKYYPTNVLITGFDIIFFWVARMIMLSMHFKKDVPFKEVLIHGLVRDEHGQKMSKSKGNGIDPLEMVNVYGADAVRFTLLALAGQGRDMQISGSKIELGRNFITKIWNAARFCEMNDCRFDSSFQPETVKEALNRWIVFKAHQAAEKIAQALETYRFQEATQEMHQFIWGTFCDWYVEMTKPVFAASDDRIKEETRRTAAYVLRQICLLIHPIMPFVSEVLWEQSDFGIKEGLLAAETAWPEILPKKDEQTLFEKEALKIDALIEMVTAIRSVRSEMNIPAGKRLSLMIKGASDVQKEEIEEQEVLLKSLARLETVSFVNETVHGAVQQVLNALTLMIPLEGVLDVDAEKERLKKEQAVLQKNIAQVDAKLSNESFIAKAPDSVVEEQRQRRQAALDSLNKIQEALARFDLL
jgi:valyl-tRNA synthetase